jgi:hypothetical protein
MSFLSGLIQALVGVAEVAAGVLIEVGTLGGGTPLAVMLIASGAGMILSGIGTMIAGDGPQRGYATTTRDPIAPWKVTYGEARVGGTIVYMNEWGDKNCMLDMVVVLACHPSESVDEILFDQQRVQIDTNAIPTDARAGYTIPRKPDVGAGTSFTPVEQTVNISSIKRDINGIVTVTLPKNIPYLTAGDQIIIQKVPGMSSANSNGKFQVAQILSQTFGNPGSIVFTYLNGGDIFEVDNSGQAVTTWPDYGRNVYFEPILGTQALGETFAGMTAGTPWQGTGKLCTPASPQNAGGTSTPNPWTNYCSLEGMTAVFIRLHYDQNYFPQGMPQISFHMRGKNNIYDPETLTTGYSNNAALCIADYLSDKTWGFNSAYGTEIPIGPLIDAKHVCDEQVALALGGAENRYECNGSFDLSMRRGEVLQNLLTACAGRLTYYEGQFIVHPAKWSGPYAIVDLQATATGPMKWKPNVTVRDLYNGCKGTYISPENKWQSTDFPHYTQDVNHGYKPGIEWTSGHAFSNGDYAVYGGVSYQSLKDSNTDHIPSVEPSWWLITSGVVDINVLADGGDRRWLDIKLPFTISYACAQRLAKIELLRRRHQGTGTFVTDLSNYPLVPMDVIEANCNFLGFDEKLLEVQAVRLRNDKSGTDGAVALSCEIDVQESSSEIYSWSTEEEQTPQGYTQSKYPQNDVIEQVPYPWSPGHTAPLTGDALLGPASFGIKSIYGADGAGTPTAQLQISGYAPVNEIDVNIASPQVSLVPSESGGTLQAGTYVIGVAAWNNNTLQRNLTDYLTLEHCSISGSTGSIAVNITWGSGNDGGSVFVAQWPNDVALAEAATFQDALVWHWNQDVAPDSSATITNFDDTTSGGVDYVFDHFSVTWQQVIHSGVWDSAVTSVSSNSVTLAIPGVTENTYTGYVLSLLGYFDPTNEVPILNLPVASNTATNGSGFVTFTIGPNFNGDTLGDLTTLLNPNDLVVMRMNPTFTDTTITDTNITNGFYPNGAKFNNETGHVAVVLSGADKGDVKTLSGVSTDGNTFILASPFTVTPATGDIVIICSANKFPEVAGSSVTVPNNLVQGVVAKFDIKNLTGSLWLFTVRTEDTNGNHGPDCVAPSRELYLTGNGLTEWVGTWFTMRSIDGRLQCDSTSGPYTIMLLPQASIPQQLLVVEKISADVNVITVSCAVGDTFGDGTTSFTLTNQGDSRLLKF